MLPHFRLLGMTDNQHRRILELRSSFCLSVIDGQNEKNDRRDEGPALVYAPPRETNPFLLKYWIVEPTSALPVVLVVP